MRSKQIVSRSLVRFWFPVLLILIGLAGCTVSRSPVTGKRTYYGYTWEEEKELGAQADIEIQAQYGTYQEDDLDEYVNDIAQKVLQHSHLRGPYADPKYRQTEFTFRVLDSPVVNAFALPGGYVYVTRGLLAYVQNEAQLAVVLGHEIGHVAERHASRQALQQKLGQIGLIGGAILGQEVFNVPAQQIMNIGGTAVQLLFLKYSREHERESDQLGVEYASKAGYVAAEGGDFFWALEQLGAENGQSLPTFLSTHPDPGDREDTIKQLAAKWADTVQVSIIHHDIYFKHLQNIVFSEDPRQGFVQNNMFYHPSMRFQFPVPPGWRVQNSASQVVLMEPNQQAALLFTVDPEAQSVREAANRFTSQQGIQVEESGATSVNSMSAYRVIALVQPQQSQQVLRLISVFIEKTNTVYQFIGYSRSEMFSDYLDSFQRSINGFNELRDREILEVQPWRIHLVTADHQGSLEEFVPDNTRQKFGLSMLRILNQLKSGNTVEQGQVLKVPER